VVTSRMRIRETMLRTWHLHTVHWSICHSSPSGRSVPLLHVFKHWHLSRPNTRSSYWSAWNTRTML